MKTKFAVKNSSMHTKVYALSSNVRLSSARNLSYDNEIGTVRKETPTHRAVWRLFDFFFRATPHISPVLSINTVKINRFCEWELAGAICRRLTAVNVPLIYYASLYSRLSLARFIRVIYHRDLFPGDVDRRSDRGYSFSSRRRSAQQISTIRENCHTHDVMSREDTNYPFQHPFELDLLTYIPLTGARILALKKATRRDCENDGREGFSRECDLKDRRSWALGHDIPAA